MDLQHRGINTEIADWPYVAARAMCAAFRGQGAAKPALPSQTTALTAREKLGPCTKRV